MSFFKSEYYDKPEGEDYIGKIFATNRLAVTGALGIGEKFLILSNALNLNKLFLFRYHGCCHVLTT